MKRERGREGEEEREGREREREGGRGERRGGRGGGEKSKREKERGDTTVYPPVRGALAQW